MRWILTLCFLFFIPSFIIAQEEKESTITTQASAQLPQLTDTITSLPLLEKKKTKTGQFLNRIFVKRKRTKTVTPPQKVEQHFDYGEGKHIRNINIITLDPFGYSDTDSTKVPNNKLERFGNKLHLKSKKSTIKNFLLFKTGDTFDSLRIKESERLIRTQNYIRRVTIYAVPTESKDSVDIVVRSLDSWSIYPSGSLSTSNMRIRLRDRNFGGFGHDVTVQFKDRFKEGKDAYYFNYHVNNIQNTFIRGTAQYESDIWGNYIKGLALDRPFYSPYTKWAGGASFVQRHVKDSFPDADEKYKIQSIKYNTFDFWGGYSLPLQRETIAGTLTNLRMSARFIQQDFKDAPQESYDPLGYYRDQRSYLFSIGLTRTNYVQDRFIFQYDLIEDVQVGNSVSLTFGMRDQYQKRRSYFGLKIAGGRYTSLGYFAGNIEWGSYFWGSKAEQGTFRFDGTYFTKLFQSGKWRFRHFLAPSLVLGYNRFDHVSDRLRLDDVIVGIRAHKVTALRRLSFSYQLQSYAPFEWKGFRFNPYLNYEAAFMGYKDKSFLSGKMYSKISLGLVANNDYLVFSSIALSLVYYPVMPDTGGAIFRANSRQYKVELPQFGYDKPRTVPYY